MKKFILAFLFITALAYRTNASPQMGEFLIIGKDTFEFHNDPLADLDEDTYGSFLKSIECTKDYKEISRCLYTVKGYQGVWKIQDSTLYLVDLSAYSNPRKIFKKVFPDKYKNGEVLADWFTSQILIPRGDILRYNDFGEVTSYLKEELMYFKSGQLINRVLVDNYVDLDNGISRLDQEKLRDTLKVMIKSFDRPKIVAGYYITINSDGKISDIDFYGLFSDNKLWQDYFKEKMKDYQFDIIKEKGVPCKETIFIE